MSMINKEVNNFKVQAFYNNSFKTVTKNDILGKWSIFFFYPADFTFVCPTELEDLANIYEKFQKAGCEIFVQHIKGHRCYAAFLLSGSVVHELFHSCLVGFHSMWTALPLGR